MATWYWGGGGPGGPWSSDLNKEKELVVWSQGKAFQAVGTARAQALELGMNLVWGTEGRWVGEKGLIVVVSPSPSTAFLPVPLAWRSLEYLGGWAAQGPMSTPSFPLGPPKGPTRSWVAARYPKKAASGVEREPGKRDIVFLTLKALVPSLEGKPCFRVCCLRLHQIQAMCRPSLMPGKDHQQSQSGGLGCFAGKFYKRVRVLQSGETEAAPSLAGIWPWERVDGRAAHLSHKSRCGNQMLDRPPMSSLELKTEAHWRPGLWVQWYGSLVKSPLRWICLEKSGKNTHQVLCVCVCVPWEYLC